MLIWENFRARVVLYSPLSQLPCELGHRCWVRKILSLWDELGKRNMWLWRRGRGRSQTGICWSNPHDPSSRQWLSTPKRSPMRSDLTSCKPRPQTCSTQLWRDRRANKGWYQWTTTIRRTVETAEEIYLLNIFWKENFQKFHLAKFDFAIGLE